MNDSTHIIHIEEGELIVVLCHERAENWSLMLLDDKRYLVYYIGLLDSQRIQNVKVQRTRKQVEVGEIYDDLKILGRTHPYNTKLEDKYRDVLQQNNCPVKNVFIIKKH